jgi:hypothetical protein
MTSASQTDFIAGCAKQAFTSPYFSKRLALFHVFPLEISAQLISSDGAQCVISMRCDRDSGWNRMFDIYSATC